MWLSWIRKPTEPLVLPAALQLDKNASYQRWDKAPIAPSLSLLSIFLKCSTLSTYTNTKQKHDSINKVMKKSSGRNR